MLRRDVIKSAGVITLRSSFPLILSQFISSCQTKSVAPAPDFFTPDEFQIVEHVSDILLPKTHTPGALEAHVPYFLDRVIGSCLKPMDRFRIKNGLIQLNDQGRRNFANLNKEEKLIMLKLIDEAAFKDDPEYLWYRIFKKLSLIGYFTSQQGMTKALNYVQVPGDYKAIIPCKKGDKALAKTFLIYW